MQGDKQPPFELGKYTVVSQLGNGAYGIVYKAKNKETGEFFAIKKLDRFRIDRHEKAKEYFNTEAYTMSKFKHRNLMRVLDLMITNMSYYIVLEFCNQDTLKKYLYQKHRSGHQVTEYEAVQMIFQILEGLRELHSNNILHRDIKLDNILIHNDIPKIGDYGFAKKVLNQGGLTSTKVGTPLYQAPEVYNTKYDTMYDYTVDIWSVGVLFYRILFGKEPWRTDKPLSKELLKEVNITQSGQNLYFPPEVPVSKELKDFLQRAIEPVPEKRIKWADIITHKLFNRIQNPESNPGLPWLVWVENERAASRNKKLHIDYYKDITFKTQVTNQEIMNLEDMENSFKKNASIDVQNREMERWMNNHIHNINYVNLMKKTCQKTKNYITNNMKELDKLWIGLLWCILLVTKKYSILLSDLRTKYEKNYNIYQINPTIFKNILIPSEEYITSRQELEYLLKPCSQEIQFTVDYAINMFSNGNRNSSIVQTMDEIIDMVLKEDTTMAEVESKLSEVFGFIVDFYNNPTLNQKLELDKKKVLSREIVAMFEIAKRNIEIEGIGFEWNVLEGNLEDTQYLDERVMHIKNEYKLA